MSCRHDRPWALKEHRHEEGRNRAAVAAAAASLSSLLTALGLLVGLLPLAWLASPIEEKMASSGKSEAGHIFHSLRLHRQEMPLHAFEGAVHHKSAYYADIDLGSPVSQAFRVVLDTGSGHLILPSLLCKDAVCRLHRRYNVSASASGKDIDLDGTEIASTGLRDQITITFGTGAVRGVFVKDRVCLASSHTVVKEAEHSWFLPSRWYSQKGVACPELRFVAAVGLTEEPFSSFEFDGILGLGFTGLSQAPEFNFLTALGAAADPWPRQADGVTFAVFLATSENEASEVTFGGWRLDHLAHGAGIQWVDVVSLGASGYWLVPVHYIKVGDKLFDICAEGCQAVVDTGTSLLGVPSEMGPSLRSALLHTTPALSPDLAACEGPGPIMTLGVGEIALELHALDYGRPVVAGVDIFDEEQSLGNSSSPKAAVVTDVSPLTCVPMIMDIDLPAPLGPRTLILGEVVLQRYLTVFDAVNRRVGFGLAHHPNRRARRFRIHPGATAETSERDAPLVQG